MIVSHNDDDHSGGAISVLHEVPSQWLVSSLPAPHAILAVAPQPRRCFAGQHWEWDEVRFDMLHPSMDSYADTKLNDNARSCVLKITSRYGSMLLPADIESPSERLLLETGANALAADVLVVPHHGSKTSSSEAFIAQVHPAIAILTTGYRNRFGHPREGIVARYQQAGSHIYRSDKDGAILLDFSSNGINVHVWRQATPRYWHQTAVKAGS